MTVARDAVTIENTLMEVVGALHIERANELTGREPASQYFYSASNPNAREQLSVRDMLVLDQAWRASGRTGYPLYETVGRILEAEASERFADAVAVALQAVELTREGGEACAAMMEASFPGASRSVLEHALRQVEESDQAHGAAIALLRSLLDRQRSQPPP